MVDPNGLTTTLAYDDNNRLTTISVDSGGAKQAITTFAYDAIGPGSKRAAGLPRRYLGQ